MKNKFEILIIDDNANFVERMVELLNDSVNLREIKTASNYDAANRLLLTCDPDVYLLDINLPGKNGIEILRQIKNSSKTGNVIMMTNHSDEYYKDQCNKLGATYFMDKSYDFDLIPAIVQEFEHNWKNEMPA